jgi:maltooligosyltrehalose trehalohydrolase
MDFKPPRRLPAVSESDYAAHGGRFAEMQRGAPVNASDKFPLGSTYLADGRCRFLVWAPKARTIVLEIVHPARGRIPLEAGERGYFHAVVDGIAPGARYFYILDESKKRPDPASRYQPEGVHGPSEVIDACFGWEDSNWHGLPIRDYILYELHTGTFTPEGTFDAIIPHLDGLVRLGVTVIELMPVGQFPGTRNWGYDGTYCFAAQNSYGGPDGLRRLINACHRRGLGVALDVVYNHLGPEGNYLDEFGHYFTDRYQTPWGRAINFDDRHSDEVRRYFIENALHWATDFHVDSLRLDAVHSIFDESARPFLRELGQAVHDRATQLDRRITVIAESNQNDVRHSNPPAIGGYGLDGQWNDDFHHCIHVLLTGEQSGYYADFGGVKQMAKAMAEGFVYDGQFSPFRQRRHGVSSHHVPAERFVICSQNHDQVGNRALGERLGTITCPESAKLAAGLVLSSPYVPLLFMGEEYGETAPFLYFVSHSDPKLIEAVRRGRQQEFASFEWKVDVPDPQAESTFRNSILNRALLKEPWHASLWEYYRELIRLRRTVPALARLDKQQMEVVAVEATQTMFVYRWDGDSHVALVYHFGEAATWCGSLPPGIWQVLLDSEDERWHGSGTRIGRRVISERTVSLSLLPKQVVVLRQEG